MVKFPLALITANNKRYYLLQFQLLLSGAAIAPVKECQCVSETFQGKHPPLTCCSLDSQSGFNGLFCKCWRTFIFIDDLCSDVMYG